MHRASINHRPEKCHDRNFLTTLIVYFVVIDPIGAAAIFLALTAAQDEPAKIRTAIEATLVATLIMVFFALCGSWVLQYLKIGEPTFKIAGGIILFHAAWDMLNSKRQARKRLRLIGIVQTIPALAFCFALSAMIAT
jgi:small neutral amino acid transporter SnatA (MarC family)